MVAIHPQSLGGLARLRALTRDCGSLPAPNSISASILVRWDAESCSYPLESKARLTDRAFRIGLCWWQSFLRWWRRFLPFAERFVRRRRRFQHPPQDFVTYIVCTRLGSFVSPGN